MTTRRVRVFYIILFCLLLYSLAIRMHLTWNRRFNADEFQHLHAAWMVHSGYFPYRDFWDNHTPLLHYFLASGFPYFEEGVPLMMFVRGIMSTVGLLIVWLTYRIARFDHDRFTSLLCALVLSFSVLFIQKTIEIRPDQFLVILWLASVWIYIRFFSMSKNGLHLIAAGLLLGMGMLFSPKALLCFAAFTLTFAANSISSIISSESKREGSPISGTTRVYRFHTFFRVIRDCLYYALGFLIPISACALFFWQKKSLGMLVDSTILENLDYPNFRRPTYLLSLQHIVLFLIAFAGMIVCFLERNIHRSTYRSRFLIGVVCFILMFIFLFLMPAQFQQSALVFVPFLAIYAGIALKKSAEPVIVGERSLTWKQKSLLAFTLLTGVLIPCGSLFVKQPTTGSNAEQLELMRTVLNHTNQHDVIFDGNAAYVFRPQAYYYGSLVEGIRERIGRGEVRISIPQSLKDHHCKFIIYDDRVSRLPTNVQEFIRHNYIPTQFPEILVAGRELRAESFSGRKARFWIEIALKYSIQTLNNERFVLDGKPYTSPVFLTTGIHELVGDQDLHYVILRAVND
jgi:Dolichyl-phosphate-mannose-protein mannosyltransferase